MGKEWYYSEEGEQRGPVSLEKLASLLNAGSIPADAHVWSDGMKDWRPASEVPEITATLPAVRANTPLMEVAGSRLATSEVLPNKIFIFEDRIEEHDTGFLKKSMQTIRHEQVAQVSISRGVVFSQLTIESTGGHAIVARGLTRGEAEDAKRLLDDCIRKARRPAAAPAQQTREPDVLDQIRKLGELRDAGLLTPEEFESKKSELLKRL